MSSSQRTIKSPSPTVSSSSSTTKSFGASQQWLQANLSESDIEHAESLFHDKNNIEHQFCLGCVLIKSDSNEKIQKSIHIFSQLEDNVNYRREALYYSAFAHVKLNKLFDAKRILFKLLIKMDPEHSQGKLLLKKVEERIASQRTERRNSAQPVMTSGTVLTFEGGNNNSNSSSSGNSSSGRIVGGLNGPLGNRLVLLSKSTPETTDSEIMNELKNRKAALAMMAQSVNKSMNANNNNNSFSSKRESMSDRGTDTDGGDQGGRISFGGMTGSFVKLDSDAIMSRIPVDVRSLLTETFYSFDHLFSKKSHHLKCAVIDQEQFSAAVGLLGLDHSMGQFVNRFLFRGFYMLERSLRSSTSGVTFISQRKFSEGEEICLETFLCGMAILLYGTDEERGQFSFHMLDIDRKGYLVESDFAAAFKAIMEIYGHIGLDSNETIETIAAKVFKTIDIYETQQLSGTAFLIGLSKYRYIISSAFTSDEFKMNLSNATARGVPALFGTTDWDYCMSIMIGIRQAQDMFKPMRRDLTSDDFSLEVSFKVPLGSSTIGTSQNGIHHSGDEDCNLFIDYAPRVFRKLRERSGVSESEYMYSLGPDQLLCNLLYGQLSGYRIQGSEDSGGRSGSSFLFTHDGKFIIKNVSGPEFANFRRVLPEYYHYLNTNPNSLIMKVYGCFVYDGKGYIIMKNVFCTSRSQHEIFDLKGSTVSRSNPDGPVYKDMDLTQKIVVGSNKRSQLLNILNKDIKFLCDNSFTDYSLLLGIHYVDGYEGKAIQDIKNKSDRTARNWQEQLKTEGFGSGIGDDQVDSSDINSEPSYGSLSSSSDDSSILSTSQFISEQSQGVLQMESERPVVVPEAKGRMRSGGRPRNGGGRIRQLGQPIDRRETLFSTTNEVGNIDNGIVSLDNKQIYYLGIVDTLTEFSVSKAVELNLKTIKYGVHKRSQISSQPSGEYAQRIKTFVENLVQ